MKYTKCATRDDRCAASIEAHSVACYVPIKVLSACWRDVSACIACFIACCGEGGWLWLLYRERWHIAPRQ